jgi:hypothetical protein
MHMPPQEENKEEQVDREWSSYPSPTPKNGNTQIPMNIPSYIIKNDEYPYYLIVLYMIQLCLIYGRIMI